LSFFKKADSGVEDAGLFVEEKGGRRLSVQDVDTAGLPSPAEYGEESGSDDVRYNESGGSVKRRKTSVDVADDKEEDTASLFGESPLKQMPNQSGRQPGPFMEESDSEQEDEQSEPTMLAEKQSEPVIVDMSRPNEEQDPATTPIKQEPDTVVTDQDAQKDGQEQIEVQQAEIPVADTAEPPPARPPLVKQESSYNVGLDEFNDFEDMDDFDEDLYEEGDEFRERRYMEEQAKLEADQDEKDYDPMPFTDDSLVKQEDVEATTADTGAACPICSIGLGGVSEQDAGMHVNNCLDGNPTPLPERKKPPSPSAPSTKTASADQYKRPVRAAKPGQASPFTFGQPTMNGGSAFNKLMSGHAEDAAWAEAAAAEHKSRGKPAYTRTCPFYKIMPGLFICVDAFRYGAVQGCKAYFLSHFHSDHYVGLTSTWSHGPIYCSKVTANLVRQQLRVDPRFVIGLEFEETVEVPGTKGVQVTMISANHCPGSSLFLFEKAVGKKQNGETTLQRILHCGDFRACRAHIEHPLLMPNVQDKVTGKNKEQKIDVCYLDTTYLNPKYAFPSQESVIKACADMCVSLSKHTVDEDDGWEQMKRRRAGEGMVKFVRKESNSEIKEEPADEDDTDAMKLEKNPYASQQILRTSSLPDAKDGRGRLLVVVGTYSIGKERICLGIARALNCKIYAPPGKMRIVAALEDPELNALMTGDPKAAQIHMTPLFEIRAETLDDYLKDYFPYFTRAVGFRPSGWNYRPPTSRFLESPSVTTVLNGDNWKSNYSMKELVPQRGSTSRASCFGVPYSEHSSFRELTMFCCALRIEKIIPTVNVGSAKGRGKMKDWCERWMVERRRNGPWKLPEDGSW